MFIIRKLKPDRSLIGLVPAMVTLVCVAIIWVAIGRHTAVVFVALVFFALCFLILLAYVKTTNTGYLVNGLFLLFGGIAAANLPSGFLHFDRELLALCFLLEFIFLGWTAYLLIIRKYKWRGREILELAAAPVVETGNGFTGRPRPSGRAEYSKDELLGFARFLLKNLVSIPYRDTNRIILVPVNLTRSYLYLYGKRPDLSRDTWVSFDFEGRISVNISKRDYFNYTENLSFDQLCESLGILFIEFLNMYKRGEGIRIIDKLNAVRENPFT